MSGGPLRALLEDEAGRPIGPGGDPLTKEQARVVLEREGPLMVAANAGSGKTTVLVERFVRHVVDDGLDPRSILAITFTRRAAGQLRERIRTRFMQLGCTEHARAMDGAWISTIDGFCLRVLRSHAVVAGLDPELAVLDPGELRSLREHAWEDTLAALLGQPGTPPPPGVLGVLDRFGYQPLRTLISELYDELRSAGQTRPSLPVPATPTLDDAEFLPALVALDELLLAFGDAFTAAKRERRGLDYADLAIATRDLLRARPEIARGYAERLQRVLVDEFQDTNRLQLDLLDALGQEQRFLVGDRLQSIYGFRHADIGGFERAWTAYAADGRARSLATNFRSHPAILELINTAFGPFQDDFAQLEPGLEAAADDPPPVEVLLTDTDAWRGVPPADPLLAALADGMPAGTPTQVQAEARLVAQRARELLDGGCKAGEVVVLLRAGTHMAAYERALELASVPAVATQGRGWWSRREVQDLLNHVRVLVNPLDEVALLGALASPFAGLGTDDLARLALERRRREGATTLWEMVTAVAGGARDGLLGRIDEPVRERLGAYVALVTRERRAGAWTGPAEILERVVEETGYDAHVVQGPGGLRRMANVRKLIGMADAFAARSGPDLRAFADYAAAELAAGASTPDAPLEVGADQAVRLMTIHGAKGLEFPVVILADLGRDGGGSTPAVLVSDERVGLRLPRTDGETADIAFDYAELDRERMDAEAREERRVMHVAVTRAERLLILSGTFRSSKGWGESGYKRPALAWMGPGLFGGEGTFPPRPGTLSAGAGEARVIVSEPGGVLSLATAGDTAGDDPGAAPAATSELQPVVDAAVGPPPPAMLSYSSLSAYARCGYSWYLRRVLGLPETRVVDAAQQGGFSDDARRRGSIAHAVLEYADLSPAAPALDADAVRAAAAAIEEQLDDSEIPDQLQLAAGFLNGPWRDRAAAATSVQREVGFVFPLQADAPDGPLLNGVIDLLAHEDDGGVLIVDHKTDRIADETDLEALVARDYVIQRAVYALAALRGGATRVEVAHVYLQTGAAASAVYAPADMPALEGLVQASAAALLAGEFPVTAVPHAGLCATCPGRGGLCSAPLELTDRPRPDA